MLSYAKFESNMLQGVDGRRLQRFMNAVFERIPEMCDQEDFFAHETFDEFVLQKCPECKYLFTYQNIEDHVKFCEGRGPARTKKLNMTRKEATAKIKEVLEENFALQNELSAAKKNINFLRGIVDMDVLDAMSKVREENERMMLALESSKAQRDADLRLQFEKFGLEKGQLERELCLVKKELSEKTRVAKMYDAARKEADGLSRKVKCLSTIVEGNKKHIDALIKTRGECFGLPVNQKDAQKTINEVFKQNRVLTESLAEKENEISELVKICVSSTDTTLKVETLTSQNQFLLAQLSAKQSELSRLQVMLDDSRRRFEAVSRLNMTIYLPSVEEIQLSSSNDQLETVVKEKKNKNKKRKVLHQQEKPAALDAFETLDNPLSPVSRISGLHTTTPFTPSPLKLRDDYPCPAFSPNFDMGVFNEEFFGDIMQGSVAFVEQVKDLNARPLFSMTDVFQP